MRLTAPPATSPSARRALRLAQLGILGLLYFVLASVALHWLAPELDPRTHFLSEYGLGPYAWLLSSALIALGLGSLALARGLHHGGASTAQKAGLALLALWGVGVVLAGLFPLDTGVLEPSSATGHIHLASAMIAFLALLASALVLTFRVPDQLHHQSVRRPLQVVAGVLVLAFLADLARPEAVQGITQRVFVLACVAWLLVVAQGLRIADARAGRP